MRKSAFRGIRFKLLVPIIIQSVVLIGVVAYVAYAGVTSRARLEELLRVDRAAVAVNTLEEMTSRYVAQIIPSTLLEEEIDEQISRIRQLTEQDDGVAETLSEATATISDIGARKRRNLAIEEAIIELTNNSMAQSDQYIEQTVSRLADPAQAGSVTTLERLVIQGAHINSTSAWAIQKLFYEMSYDPSRATELTDFVELAIANTEQDAERLAGTRFEQLPIEARRSNMEIAGLIDEYIRITSTVAQRRAALEELLGDLDVEHAARLTELLQETSQIVQSSFLWAAILILTTLVAVGAVFWVLGSRIASAIASAARMLTEIAQGDGDLTGRLEVSRRDEIGELAKGFNATMDNIHQLVVTIKKEAGVLRELGADLVTNMTEAAASVNEISANTSSIQNRTENQSESVERAEEAIAAIARQLESLNARIADQAASVVESSSSIEQMVANIASVSRTLETNAAAFDELASAAASGNEKMDEVTSRIQEIARESEGLIEASTVIESIASQTNLLAMNAAIEAAHAGELGRGFAVVSDEIRKLAESSGEQGKSISGVLKGLKSAIDDVVTASAAARDEFSHVVDLTNDANQREHIIKSAMEEQESGSSQVLEAIREINEITTDVRTGAKEMLEHGTQARAEMEQLSGSARETSNGVAEISVGAAEINTAVLHVEDLTRKNQQSIKTLIGEISRFQVQEADEETGVKIATESSADRR